MNKMDAHQISLLSENVSLEEVIYLVEEKGADIEVVNEEGLTPLLIARINEKHNIVKYLILKGANVNTQSSINHNHSLEISYIDTLLIFYCYRNNLEMVKLLIKNGANLEDFNFYHRTPFMVSIRFNNLDIAQYLLDSGADINAYDYRKLTSLMIVALDYTYNTYSNSIIEFLIDKGADLDVKNHKGETFLECFSEENKSAKEYFEKYIENIKIANIKPCFKH
jgi:ankyrin repeat protein